MSAPNLIPADVLAEARLDRQLRATVAMLGRDPDAVLADEQFDALAAAACHSGRTTSVMIAADSDADLDERTAQFVAAGGQSSGPRDCANSGKVWRQSDVYRHRADGSTVIVTISTAHKAVKP